MKPQAILVGLAAGCAAALLFAGLILQSALAIVLALAAPVPIYIASLGWGSRVGFLAAATAAIGLSAVTGSYNSGLILFVSMALPAAIVGHLAGLARPSETAAPAANDVVVPSAGPALDWYPLSRILFAIALLAVGACLFIGWLFGYDAAQIGPEFSRALSEQMGATVDPATQLQVQALAQLAIKLVPFFQPALLLLVLVAGLHLSAIATRISGRLPRPKDDIPAAAGLPKAALAVFALAVAGCFAGGTAGVVAAVFAGAFGTAFTLVGLASLHRRTRGATYRGLVLFSAYAAIVLLTFPLAAATLLGIFETARRPETPGLPGHRSA